MITFKQFLNEAVIKPWSVDKPGLKKAIELLNKNHRAGLHAIQSGGLLFRGFKSGMTNRTAIIQIDTTKSHRTSRDSSNLYQLMMDTSTALKQFPSRSNSLICSTSIYTAAGYGDLFVIVPIDGTMIAMSGADDFLNDQEVENAKLGFRSMHLDMVNSRLDRILKTFKIKKDSKGKFTDINRIDAALAKLTSEEIAGLLFGERLVTDASDKLIAFLDANKSNRLSALSSVLMTPSALDLKLKEFGQHLQSDRECWFSGKAIAIPWKTFELMIPQLIKLGVRPHKDYNFTS